MTIRLPLSRRIWIAFVAAPLVGLAAYPSVASSFGLDVWSLPALQQSMEESRARSQELDVRNDDVRKRILIKEVLISDLIAERSTLEEVARQFLALNETSPEYMEVIRASYSGSTDLEKTIQNVIDFASLRVPEGARRDALIARLEMQRERINRHQVAQ